MRCGRCDTRLIARGDSQRGRSYVCGSAPDKGRCGGIRITADRLEHEVADQVLAALDSPEFRTEVAACAAGAQDREAALTEKIDRVGHQFDQAATDHYVEGLISRAQLTATSRTVQARRDAAHAELGVRVRRSGLAAVTAPADWDELGFDRQRALPTDVLERVVVGPALRPRQWDPARVTVTWRA